MDNADINNLIARLERLEQENKELKKWVGRLRQDIEKLNDKIDTPVSAKASGGISQGQRKVMVATVAGVIILGFSSLSVHQRLDSMKNYMATKEMLITDEKGNIGVVLSNSIEHGPRLFMNGTIQQDGFPSTGPRRIIIGVAKDGQPSLSFFREANEPKPLSAGPLGIVVGLTKDDHPQIFLNGPVGQNGIYMGTKPKPAFEIIGVDGRNIFQLPP